MVVDRRKHNSTFSWLTARKETYAYWRKIQTNSRICEAVVTSGHAHASERLQRATNHHSIQAIGCLGRLQRSIKISPEIAQTCFSAKDYFDVTRRPGPRVGR